MKHWKYTILLGFSGAVSFFLTTLAVIFFSYENLEKYWISFILLEYLFLPVLLFAEGLDSYLTIGLGIIATGAWYVFFTGTTMVLCAFLQFAIVGHVIDHIVSFVKDSRKKKLTEPTITEHLE